MAQRAEINRLEAAYAALLSQGLDGANQALRLWSARPPSSNSASVLTLNRTSACGG